MNQSLAAEINGIIQGSNKEISASTVQNPAAALSLSASQNKTVTKDQTCSTNTNNIVKKKWTSRNKILFGIGIWDGSKKKPSKNKDNKPKKCSICDKVFKSNTHYEKHMLVHSGVIKAKTYECSVCQKRFNNKFGLDRHSFVHSGISDSVCSFCDKKFATKQALVIHIRSHTVERPYSCDKCSKTYTCQANLNRHALCHSERKFLCSECGKKFITNAMLSVHMQSHVTERKFPCTKCRLRFKRKVELVRHQLKHQDVQKIPCPMPQCEHLFRRKDNLIRHLRLTHDQTKEEANESFNLVNSWKGSECNDNSNQLLKDSDTDDEIHINEDDGENSQSGKEIRNDFSDIVNLSSTLDIKNEEDTRQTLYNANEDRIENRLDPLITTDTRLQIDNNIPFSAIQSSALNQPSSVTTSVIRLVESSEPRIIIQDKYNNDDGSQQSMEICNSSAYASYLYPTQSIPSNNDYNNISNNNELLYTDPGPNSSGSEIYRDSRLQPIIDSSYVPHNVDGRYDTLFPHRYLPLDQESNLYGSLQNLQAVQDLSASDPSGFLDLSCQKKLLYTSQENSVISDTNYGVSPSTSWQSPLIMLRSQGTNGRSVIRRASPMPNFSSTDNNFNTSIRTNVTSTYECEADPKVLLVAQSSQNLDSTSNTQAENAYKARSPEREGGTNLPYFNRDPRKNFLWENFNRHKL